MSTFSDLFAREVSSYKRAAGVTQRYIAELLDMNPTTLSRLVSGSRPPKSRDSVLALAWTLGLSSATTDELLTAANFQQLTEGEAEVVGQRDPLPISSSVTRFPSPEREIFNELTADVGALFSESFRSFRNLNELLHRAEWKELSKSVDEAEAKYYERLRGIPAKFLAYLMVMKSTSKLHQGDFDEAATLAASARNAASAASDPVTRCLAEIQLGDVDRIRGNFTKSASHYAAALRGLREWEPNSINQSRWKRHMVARIWRKHGALYLFQGQPHRSLAKLTRSQQTFDRTKHLHELQSVTEAMIWAHALAGNWDEAERLSQRLLEMTPSELGEIQDPKARLQALLSLGNIYLNQRRFASAEEQLLQAKLLIDSRIEPTYHEKGRVYLLLALLYSRWQPRGSQQDAEEYFSQSADFYEKQPWRDSSRLAYVHINYGRFRLDTGSPLLALKDFEYAFTLSQNLEPPHRYYMAAALAEQCHALLLLAERDNDFDSIAEAAQVACTCGRYWRHLARVEAAWALSSAKRNNFELSLVHARAALESASRFNIYVTKETREDLLKGSTWLPEPDRGRYTKFVTEFEPNGLQCATDPESVLAAVAI